MTNHEASPEGLDMDTVLPPQLVLIDIAEETAKALHADAEHEIFQLTGQQPSYYPITYVKEDVCDISLPTVGADAVTFELVKSADFDGGEYDPKDPDNPELVAIVVKLLANGEPHIAEGDVKNPRDVRDPILRGGLDRYEILLAKGEMPPTIVQASQTDFIHPDSLRTANKQRLSPQECRDIMGALPTLEVDITTQIRELRNLELLPLEV